MENRLVAVRARSSSPDSLTANATERNQTKAELLFTLKRLAVAG